MQKLDEATWRGSPQEAHVRFLTTHKAKGLGFAHVFVSSDFLGRGPPACHERPRAGGADGRPRVRRPSATPARALS